MLSTLDDFNQAYLKLHVPKEDAFWSTYMGTAKSAGELERAEAALKEFVSGPENLLAAREALKGATSAEERIGLEGWVRFFEANTIESARGRELQAALIDAEAAVFKKRAAIELSYEDRHGIKHPASTNVLSVNVSTSPDETIRRSSYAALLQLEQTVLRGGYLEQVRLRNEFARALGYPDYFTYKLMKNEGLTPDELAWIFTPFAAATREKCFSEFARLSAEKGPDVLQPYQLTYSVMGDVTAEMDPYFSFADSVARWGLSFWRMGIRFRGATLTLDLLDRPGKYENGFMHGPVPCYCDQGRWVPARIGFTSNATPTQVGSGFKGLHTLLHEGGHAAHFSNIRQNSPCFSQEFPPTSMAYAETQSMFCDSLLGDADWQKRYALDAEGNAMPDALIQKQIELRQPLSAYEQRRILVVSVFEQRLYALADHELTPERVTALARACEKEIFNLDQIARPMLIIPHLLSESGACSYQGYLLANMAVYQTRAYFLKKYGALTDVPEIGEELSQHYWAAGNRVRHAATVEALTGEPLSGAALAAECNRSNAEAWAEAKASIETLANRPPMGSLASVDLDAKIRIVHGDEVIAETKASFQQMADDFRASILARA